jgi:hypothetical protein
MLKTSTVPPLLHEPASSAPTKMNMFKNARAARPRREFILDAIPEAGRRVKGCELLLIVNSYKKSHTRRCFISDGRASSEAGRGG